MRIKKEANGWRVWRSSLKGRAREKEVISNNVEALKESNVWYSISEVEKREIIKELAAPFQISDDEVNEFLACQSPADQSSR